MSIGLSSKIILALSHTDQFKYPLTRDEIFLRIIGSNQEVGAAKLDKELNNLVLRHKIFIDQGLYFLKGSNKYISTRLKRREYSEKKWLEAEQFARGVKIIPWVKGIVVTGSLAADNAMKNDDIDFLIIVQENRLWISRLFIVFFSLLNNKKRSWDGDYANTWCLNLWLEENSLKMPKRLENIYGALEVCQAVWVYSRQDTKEKFFNLNNWAEKFLPNYFKYQKENKTKELPNNHELTMIEPNQNFSSIGFFLDRLNSFMFFLQYLYMKPHMTSENVNKNYAFFHPRNTKRQVLGNWIRKYREVARLV